MTHRALRLGSFFSYFLVGLFLTLVGPVIPEMREEFHLSHGEVSRVFLAQGAGFILAVLFGGVAADRYDKRRLVTSGFLFLGAGLCAFAWVDSWSVTLGLFFALGLGFGTGEAALNAVFFDLSQGSEGRGLNALHIAPAIGGILGALFAAALLPLGWRAPFVALGALLLAGGVCLGLSSYPKPARRESVAEGSFREVALHPVILMLGVMMAAYVGVEGSMNGWTVTYAGEALGGSTLAGSLLTSAFWLGLAAGRVVCARIAAPGRYARILVGSSLCAAAAYVPVLFVPSLWTLALAVLAMGLALGGLFPTAVAHGGTYFPRRAGAITGYLLAWCTVGGTALPAAVGLAADRWGIQAGMTSVWAALLLLAACALAVTPARRGPVRRRKPRE